MNQFYRSKVTNLLSLGKMRNTEKIAHNESFSKSLQRTKTKPDTHMSRNLSGVLTMSHSPNRPKIELLKTYAGEKRNLRFE